MLGKASTRIVLERRLDLFYDVSARIHIGLDGEWPAL